MGAIQLGSAGKEPVDNNKSQAIPVPQQQLSDPVILTDPSSVSGYDEILRVVNNALSLINQNISNINGTLEVISSNVSQFEIEFVFKTDSNSYMEFTETDGNVTQVNYWTDNTKTVRLFTKDITYVDGNPTIILVTNELTGMTLTTTIAYSGDDVTSITKTLV